MSFTKPKIYNIALSALLLAKEVSDVVTDNSNEVRVLSTHYDIAFESTLQDLDLDSLSQPLELELIANLGNVSTYNGPWQYVYKYPTKCVFLRRIETPLALDNKRSHIAKRTGIYDGQKAIYTNETEAFAECITNDIPLEALSPMAGMAIGYKLAFLSAPLLIGKGAKKLRDGIDEHYRMAKAEAQETDSRENFVYEAEWQRSEFVEERMS